MDKLGFLSSFFYMGMLFAGYFFNTFFLVKNIPACYHQCNLSFVRSVTRNCLLNRERGVYGTIKDLPQALNSKWVYSVKRRCCSFMQWRIHRFPLDYPAAQKGLHPRLLCLLSQGGHQGKQILQARRIPALLVLRCCGLWNRRG